MFAKTFLPDIIPLVQLSVSDRALLLSYLAAIKFTDRVGGAPAFHTNCSASEPQLPMNALSQNLLSDELLLSFLNVLLYQGQSVLILVPCSPSSCSNSPICLAVRPPHSEVKEGLLVFFLKINGQRCQGGFFPDDLRYIVIGIYFYTLPMYHNILSLHF